MARKKSRKQRENSKRFILYILSISTLICFVLIYFISDFQKQEKINDESVNKKMKGTEKNDSIKTQKNTENVIVFNNEKNKKKLIVSKANNKNIRQNRIDTNDIAKFRLKKAELVIIIDDVGYEMEWSEKFFDLEIELTFAILPELQKSRDYYHKILERPNFNAILHLPMEPHNNKDPGPEAIFRITDNFKIEQKLNQWFAEMPGLIGANNHMGSLATEDKRIMFSVLSYMQKNNLIWIDSLTTKKSIAAFVAHEIHYEIYERDLFLDNENQYDYILLQFEKLIQMAKHKSYAVGIGHFNRKAFLDVLIYFSQKQDEYNIRFINLEKFKQINKENEKSF